MVKHVLCNKLKDSSRAEKERIRDLFLSMRGKVAEIVDMEVGIDYLESERSYDVVLITTHKDRQALEAYRKNPEHQKIAVQIQAARAAAVAVDFEF
jgi:hypothetical protein